MIVKLSFLLPGILTASVNENEMIQAEHPSVPSMELALTSCAQSMRSGSGMASHDIPSGILK